MTTIHSSAFTQNVPDDAPFQYSDYSLEKNDALVGGAAWIDDEYVAAADAKISANDGGFVHSEATYTVVHVWHGNFFRLSDHLDRFLAGAEKMKLESPLTKAEITAICHEVVRRTKLREATVGVTLTGGVVGRIGQDMSYAKGPQVIVTAGPYGWIFTPAQQLAGVSAIVPELTRRSGPNQVDPQIKNLQWFDLLKAEREATERGAEAAILLDIHDFVAEGPGYNVLIVKDGAISTPSVAALPGVTRRTALEIAEAHGIATEIRNVTTAELYAADELIVTTTAGGVTPITSLDGKALGEGTPGPIGTLIQKRYWQLMDEASDLLDPVDYDA